MMGGAGEDKGRRRTFGLGESLSGSLLSVLSDLSETGHVGLGLVGLAWKTRRKIKADEQMLPWPEEVE
jgi:hypothetical protein